MAETVAMLDPRLLATQALDDALLGETKTSAVHSVPSAGAARLRLSKVLPEVELSEGGGVALVQRDGERYRYEAPLGAGGMGEAFRVEDVDIGRKVAIKRLLPAAGDAIGVARFVEEVRTVGSLEHPNVVPIHDVGIDSEGRYFFVMKYVEGDTLEQIIEKLAAGDAETHRQYTFERRVLLFMGVLRALEYAHAQCVVHRDIKPANVIIGKHGEVWLMDWGVAMRKCRRELIDPNASELPQTKAQVRTTRHGTLVGTPAYMSPEQATGQRDKIDARSDLYSACVMFHELLTLRHYLEERMGSYPALLIAITTENPSLYRMDGNAQVQGHAPAELIHFVRRGIEKDPSKRWTAASQMVEELQAILEGRVRVQCPATAAKSVLRALGRFVDRSPRAVIILMLLGGLATVGWVAASTVARAVMH